MMKAQIADGVKLIAGTGNPDLAEEIAKHLGIKLVELENTTFPDGERFVQIKEHIRGQDIFILQPTCPPVDSNLMELLIMVDTARRASAERITAVLPFFGYARQDRKDRPRVPITAKLVANILVAAGVDRVLTMDLHAQQIQGFFDIPVDHLYASPILVNAIKEKNIPDLVVVSPDAGGIKMSQAYAQSLGVPLAIVAKNRINAEEVESITLIGEVEGKNVLLVDDLTESAGTLVGAANLLKERGAKDIYVAVSHAVLNDKAREKLNNSPIKEVFTTNSVPQAFGPKVTTLSVAPLLAEAISRIHQDESVTSLFKI